MQKEPKKYALIQIPADVHEELKEYTKKHGFKIGALVVNLIKKEIKRKHDGYEDMFN